MRRFIIEYDWYDSRQGHIRRRVEGVQFSNGGIAWAHLPVSYGGGSGVATWDIGRTEEAIYEHTVYLATGQPVEYRFTWLDEEGA